LQKKKNSLQEIEYTIKDNKTVELNSDYIITRIAWTKNEDDKLNYLLGVFEVANDPSFSDAIPIALIKDQEVFDEINYIDVNVTKYYKYLRYTPPILSLIPRNRDISPIKLYGKPASVINTNLKKDFQPTNLPLIIIYTQNSTEPLSKEEKIDCEVSIINEEKTVLKENATIRVRGKSTSATPKKPYLIKFSKKQTILGLKGQYKKWVLLANIFDISSIRNALAFKMSELMQFDFTPRCFSVDLILNGAYRGNYYLCDDVEIGPDRINIDELKKKDIEEPNISGGYFFEIDGGGDSYGYTNLVTKTGIKWRIKEPDEEDITKEQTEYIIKKMENFEKEVYSGNFTNMDLESYSKFFLMDEFCGDPDEISSNFYITKKRNDDKFYFGPVWDFDLAFDNDKRLYPINEKTNFLYGLGSSAGTMFNFTDMLIKNKTIINYIKDTWEKLKSTTFKESVLIDFIEQENNHIKESAILDLFLWDNLSLVRNPHYRHSGELITLQSRENDLNELKEFVKKRFTSLTNVINKAASEAK
jgi:hypothetical protein